MTKRAKPGRRIVVNTHRTPNATSPLDAGEGRWGRRSV